MAVILTMLNKEILGNLALPEVVKACIIYVI